MYLCNYHENQENAVPLRISYSQMTLLIHLHCASKCPITFLDIDFDIWLLETGQLRIIFSSESQFSQKKLSKATNAKKAIESQQSTHISRINNIECVISTFWILG